VAPFDPRLVVGFDLADDAGVVRLGDGRCLVHTVDFFTPIVDDPFTFGAIAAANGLSDVYAMGAEPLSALNILCWPTGVLPIEVLQQVLRGGAAKVAEAGAMLVGGHSVTDNEPKYGLAVTGLVQEDRLWTNAGARAGDRLVLTKALGTGIIATAAKRDACPEDARLAAEATMLALNRAGRDAAARGPVHAATDITGYGLVGHAWELAKASGVRLRIAAETVPLLPHARELAAARHLTRGERSNRAYVGDALTWQGVPGELQSVLVDPQTSGGLLLSLPPEQAARLVAEGTGVDIGGVEAGPPGLVIAGG